MKNSFIILGTLLILTQCVGQEKTEKKKDTVKIPTVTKLSLLFTGDFMGHKDQINAAYDKTTDTYNYKEHFKYISKTLSTPDLTIGNLEVPLGIKPYSGYPQFSSPAVYAKYIRDAGVDVLATANNHSCDKRKRGLEKTIQLLDTLYIPHLGTYASEKEKKLLSPFIIEEKGFRIALLNYTYGTNGIKPTPPNVVNYLKKETVLNDIKKAKEAKVDKIIAYVHWGKEYKDFPDGYQKKWEKILSDNGVDFIIGAHPHTIQPMKFDKKKGTLIAYSLGNFISHQRTFPRDGGAVIKLDLSKDKGVVKLDSVSYKLTWVYEPIINGEKEYHVLPVCDFENKPNFFKLKKDYDKMMRYVKHARKLLGENNIEVNEFK